MTEKTQAYARQSARRGLCAVLPIIIHSCLSGSKSFGKNVIFRAKTSINKDIDKENIRKQDMDLYVKLHKSFCQKSDNMIKTTFFQLFSCSAEKKGV